MRLNSSRVLRPLSIHGRIAGVNELVRLPDYMAAEWIETGHLRQVEPVNGHAKTESAA